MSNHILWRSLAMAGADRLYDRAYQAVHGGQDAFGLPTQMRLGSFACIVADETQPDGFSYGLYQDIPTTARRFASLTSESVRSKDYFGLALMSNFFAVIETTCIHCGEKIIRERADEPFFHIELGNERCEDSLGATTDEFATPGMFR